MWQVLPNQVHWVGRARGKLIIHALLLNFSPQRTAVHVNAGEPNTWYKRLYTSSRYSRMLSSQLLLHACQKWPQKWKGSVSKVFSDFPGHILEDCWRIINYLILYSCCRISESYFFMYLQIIYFLRNVWEANGSLFFVGHIDWVRSCWARVN